MLLKVPATSSVDYWAERLSFEPRAPSADATGVVRARHLLVQDSGLLLRCEQVAAQGGEAVRYSWPVLVQVPPPPR